MRDKTLKTRQRHRQADRQTDRQADRTTDRQADRKTDRQMGRQTDRQMGRQAGSHTNGRERNMAAKNVAMGIQSKQWKETMQ